MIEKVGAVRDKNLDLIRFIAISFVVLIHSKGEGIIYTAVPMFVMLSGYLIIGRADDFASFYRKRLPRILIPFLIWSPIMYLILCKTGRIDTPSIQDFLTKMASTGVHGAYWYVYEIIGLYLLAPFICRLVKALTSKELLLLCVFLLAGYELLLFFPENYFLQSFSWRKSIYLFYFILGYYLFLTRTEHRVYSNFILIFLVLIFAFILLAVQEDLVKKAIMPVASISLFAFLNNIKCKNLPPNLWSCRCCCKI